MNTALTPRKSPRQSRSAHTVNAILDATARILVERGYAATSTNAVADRAGVSDDDVDGDDGFCEERGTEADACRALRGAALHSPV